MGGEKDSLEVSDLAVTFASQEGSVQAVDGISFGIRQAETFGLVGESGCGKSMRRWDHALVRIMSNPPLPARSSSTARTCSRCPSTRCVACAGATLR